MNSSIFGVRLDMLLFLYWRRLRAHPLAELLAGAGVAIGVALVFGVLLANSSLTSSARRLIHGLAGSARFELAARSPRGFDARLVEEVGELEGVQVAAPVLRENVTLIGPKGQRAVQLIGVTPSLEDLGGATTQQLAAGTQLLRGGLGLPSGVAEAIGAKPGATLRLASGARVRLTRERSLFGDAFANVSASPVAVALLEVAQSLTGRQGRVSELMVRPHPGAERTVGAQLQRIAAAQHLDLRPADSELALLEVATRPQRQSTTLFSAIAVMIGFLLALNAMLLTVPERRRFIAELRVQGYDARQIVLLMGLQALVLGVAASAAGIALGALLARASFQQVPGFLSAAFPIGSEESAGAGTVAGAIACGVLATCLASASPLLDLRAGRPAGVSICQVAARSESVAARTVVVLTLVGALLLASVLVLALVAPSLTVAGGVALAVAAACLVPGVYWSMARLAPRVAERIRGSALVVAIVETRSISARSPALGAIVCLAVYGGVAIGGARDDLLRGIHRASQEYFATAPVWVSSRGDVFDTNSFPAGGSVGAIGRLPGVASVHVYQGGLLDVGERRLWVRARPAGDVAVIEASQLLHGDYVTATRLIRAGGWAAVSSDFAGERRLHVGGVFTLPTPSGTTRLRVAAITTNSGWPAGTLTLSAADYSRLWRTSEAAAIEVGLRPGVSAAAARRVVLAALPGSAGPRAAATVGTGLQVSTAAERVAQSDAAARQGLRTLGEISTLLLVAAALSVATALSAAIWQRRLRLAAMKLHGYDSGQLWRAVLIESGATIGGGALVGTLVGVIGHALASRFLQSTTGFPAPFAPGAAQAMLTIALFAAIALATIALPGAAAARVSLRAALQE
jgi:putative ABC transport system permease protein